MKELMHKMSGYYRRENIYTVVYFLPCLDSDESNSDGRQAFSDI